MRRTHTAIRIDDDLMGLLYFHAKRRGVTISQEIRDRLWTSFIGPQSNVEYCRQAALYQMEWLKQ